jgi:hypothetical protein
MPRRAPPTAAPLPDFSPGGGPAESRVIDPSWDRERLTALFSEANFAGSCTMDILTALFGSKNDVTLLQECARAVLVFVYGIVLMRLSGRRTFGKWSALDIVVSVIVGSTLSRVLTASVPLWPTLAAMAVLIALHWLAAKAAAKSDWWSRFLEGPPIVLATDGKVDEEARLSYSISRADLLEALHQKGLTGIEQTSSITIEPNGKLTIVSAK